MTIEGTGKGRLVSTGRSEPKFDVSYELRFISNKTKGAAGMVFASRRPVIDSVKSIDGLKLPMGDCDLLVGSQLIRVRHSNREPEWLVLSSDF